MNYFTYILRSLKDNSYYIGSTDNLNKRVAQHNQGSVRSTKGRLPWELIYTEEFNTRGEAFIREKYIKSRKKRKYIEQLINKKDKQ
ncbi:MAG: GIY-YIG nuclease family protein [Patescibacteria group bacterium]|jgi:putative endonuclease